MNSIKKATKLVSLALESLNREMSTSPDPKLAGVPKVQKEAFKLKLQKMHDILVSGSLPEKNMRSLGLGRAIADSWPFDSKLGEEIVKAERAYIEIS